MTRALFLVSTGRTGTTWLEHLFQTAGATAQHEPGPKAIRHVSHAYASGHLSDARARALLVRWRTEVLTRPGGPYVESSTLVYGLVRPILAAFPEAHVVHVVRDPLTFLRSGVNWGQYRSGGRVLNLLPYRRLAAPHFAPWYDLAARVEWARRDQFSRLCWAWTAMNRATREQGRGNPRFTTIRFEDLFDAEAARTTIRALLDPVGLDLSDEQIETLRTTRVNEHMPSWYKPNRLGRWPEWSSGQLRLALAECAEEAAHYGYAMRETVARERPEVVDA